MHLRSHNEVVVQPYLLNKIVRLMISLFRHAHEGWVKALIDQKSHFALAAPIGTKEFLTASAFSAHGRDAGRPRRG
jgi:hypothetical protein